MKEKIIKNKITYFIEQLKNNSKNKKWIIKDGMKNLTNDEQKKIHGLLD